MTPFRCAFVAQVAALAFLVHAAEAEDQGPAAPSFEQRTVAVLDAIQARLDSFDRRLQHLESQTSLRAEAETRAEGPPSHTALEEEVATLRHQLAWVRQQMSSAQASDGGSSFVLASQTSAPDEDSSDFEMPSADDPLYHPSRAYSGELHYGVEDAKLDIHAFVDLEYIDAGPDGARGGVSTFDNHHANLFLRSWLRPNLLAHIEVEYEHSGDVVEIDQAYASWRIDPKLNLDAGRFYTPFGIERFVQFTPINALVSRPVAMRQIVPGNFYANGIRGWGLFGEGDSSSRWTYDVAVSDGLGDQALDARRASRQTRDNNSNRALSGRVSYTFWPYFEIGTSHHSQRYSTDGDLDLRFTGIDVSGRWRGFDVRAEWVDAEIDRLGAPAKEEQGWYLQGQYSWTFQRDLFPELSLVARIDQLDLDRSVRGNDDQDFLSLGLNLKVYDHFRIKTEYQWIDENGAPRDDDTFYLQMVIDY